ncbi:MAG: translocation/assembly module TamB domain-containing protein [Bacteroidaceae bacterium]|nr:translocation/assembly module TamB domain-containing protein [Bacteroidaceae bacterium]
MSTEQQNTTEERPGKSLFRRVMRVILTLILLPIVMLWVAVALLYVPAVQKFAVEKLCATINSDSDFNVMIGAFHLKFPLTATVEDFKVTQGDKNLLTGEEIEVNISLAALLKGEVELNYIAIEETSIDSDSLIDGTHIKGKIGHFRIAARNIDPGNESANIRQLYLTDSNADITLRPKGEDNDTATNNIGWVVDLYRGTINNVQLRINLPDDTINVGAYIEQLKLNKATIDLANEHYALQSLTLKNSNANYDRGTLPDSIAPLDHISLQRINLATGSVSYNSNESTVEIKRFNMVQQEGVEIENLALVAKADSANIKIEKLAMSTRQGTVVRGDGTIPRGGGNVRANIKMHIDKRDLRSLVSTNAYKSIAFLPDSMLDAAAKVSGNLNRLNIDTLYASVPLLSRIGAKGTIENIDNSKDIAARVDFDGYIYDLARVIKQGADTLPNESMQLRGSASLEHTLCSLALRMRTRDGRAAIRGSYDTREKSYNGRVRTKGLNISYALPELPLHNLTMSMNITGKGTDIFDNATEYSCNVKIDTVRYDTIALNNITLSARQINSFSSIQLAAHDPNLELLVVSATHLDSTYVTNSSHVSLTRAQLDGIGVTQAAVTAAMRLDIEASTNMRESHKAKIVGDGFRLVTPKKTFTPAPLFFEAMTAPDTSFVNINTGDLKVAGEMSSGYTGLSRAFERIGELLKEAALSERTLYYAHDYEKELPAFSLNIDCGEENILSNFLRFKQIDFNNAKLNIKLDDSKEINGRGGLYGFKSGDMQLDTIQFSLRQDSSLIRYFAGVRTRSLDPEQKKLKFYSALYGTLNNDSLTTSYIFRDSNENIGARLKLNTQLSPRELYFHFDPDAIIFGHPFRFNRDNYLTLGGRYAVRSDIELKDSLGSGIRLLSSNDTTQQRDLSVELFNIDLKEVTSHLPFSPDISGILDADLHYRDDDGKMLISSDIQCNDIVYEGTPMGNGIIELAYLPKGQDKHYIDLTLLHNDNRVLNIFGDYNNDSIKPGIDANAVLTHFPLQLSEAFLKESGLSLGGYIDGDLSLRGNIEEPHSNGYIHFDSVSAEAPVFGARLHLKDDKVEIKENKLNFENFDIYAHGSTPFKINGTVDMQNLLNPEFNLVMRANDYQLINAKRKKGNMLYGNLSINFNSLVRGPLDALQINGSATLLGKSNITYVMQDTPLATENELDGLVQFVDFSDTTKVQDIQIPTADFGNVTMNIMLNIEEGAHINADFDENRNSYIELQGGGNLYLTYTNEAGINLTGRYTLNDGQLKYTLPIIPLKTFKISDGSYINWTGDIMNPTINITALERMSAPVTLDDGNTQAVAFDVGVLLTNTLDNMGLSFTLSAPENATVQNELNSIDKETLNKYAVTMLITGAYLGSNGGITVSNALSSFLDARINDIAGNAMKSVDINVGITDVNNSETGDTYKNYSFSFAKRFWNDRLTVVIGGEVNSGNSAQRSNSFINNVSLEWKLSEQGNRYIRLFYDKNYESILEGEITETGVGYVYKRKLDNLKELLIFRKKRETETPNNKKSNSGK